jgi:hypothetical protein
VVHFAMQALPKYALPTHHAVVRGGAPNAFFVSNCNASKIIMKCIRSVNMLTILLFVQENIVAYDETQKPNLERALVLDDAISDLPEVCIYLSFICHILYILSYIGSVGW